MKDVYLILDHLASVLRLTRRAYENPEDDAFWSEIEDRLWTAGYCSRNSRGGAEEEIEFVVKELENMNSEKVARLKPLPARAYTMICDVLKNEGLLK